MNGTDKPGRLVKKVEAESIDYLEIQSYPWLDFDEAGILSPDNPRRSVVRKDFHTEEEIATKVRTPASFARPLGPKARTLVPQDLTEEFLRSQQEINLRKRKRMLDDDELFNLELADLASHGEDFDGIWSRRGGKGPEGAGAGAGEAETPRAADGSMGAPQGPSPGGLVPPVAAAQTQAPTTTPGDNETQRAGAATREALLASLRAELGAEREQVLAAAREEGLAAGRAEGLEAGLGEGRAQGREEARVLGREEGFGAGKTEGFGAGFAEGEAKGVAAVDARTERYFHLLTEALSELEALKGEVLRAGQDVFVEIANLCAEKVLRQKLGASDAALRDLFLHALDMYLESHRVTLEMSPSDASRMRGALQEAARERNTSAPQITVRENPALEAGDFKVESDKEIMTVDLKRAVGGLIEGLRGHLFGEEPGAPRSDVKKTG